MYLDQIKSIFIIILAIGLVVALINLVLTFLVPENTHTERIGNIAYKVLTVMICLLVACAVAYFISMIIGEWDSIIEPLKNWN